MEPDTATAREGGLDRLEDPRPDRMEAEPWWRRRWRQRLESADEEEEECCRQ
jgi:hypothetical protein